MDSIPLWVPILALVFLILCSAFFAMAETALMASNKYRLRHLARRGNRHAATTLWLLERTDRLLSLVLIGSILLNTMAAGLVTAIAILYFGTDEVVIAVASAIIALLLIVFAEVAPKIIGATYPERISLFSAPLLKGLMGVSGPVTGFVNVFVNALLRLLRIRTAEAAERQRLSPDELRSIVLEGANYIPQQHRSILLNLFELDKVRLGDIMTPRAQIEALDLALPVDELRRALAGARHGQLPVHEGGIDRVVGVLQVRRAVALLGEEFSRERIRALLAPPYFIPEDTGLFAQLGHFQAQRERLGLVVDEYGELRGLVTLEDIVEELVGEFASAPPAPGHAALGWNPQGECLLDGATPLRDINRRLALQLPLDGPKTVNGLLLEHLQEIPEYPTALRIGGCVIEVMQVQNQAIRLVKLLRPQIKEHQELA